MTCYQFIDSKKADFPVSRLCKALRISTSAFYHWRATQNPQHAITDKEREELQLRVHIRASFKRSRGTYGRARILEDLREEGFHINHKRVARLMREEGLAGLPRRRFKKTTDSDHEDPVAPNLLDRQFNPIAPNQVWAGDITYIRIPGGFVYLAVLLDLFSRKVVGWSVADHVQTSLCLSALNRAALQRRPAAGWMHHSDRGSQYTSFAYQRRLSELGAVVSMSRRGNCWDNAPVESFFSILKRDLLDRRRWSSLVEVQSALSEHLPHFYNAIRRHSHNNQLSPNQREQLHLHNQQRVA